jgi:DNA-binding NarL/FixJ family response regulator
VPAAGLFWCWTVVRDGAAVVVLCRDPEPTVIALVRGGARQALVRTRLSTDTLEARVRSGARGGQTAPVAPLGGVPERGE